MPVRQAGKGVVIGEMFDLMLGLASLRDVETRGIDELPVRIGSRVPQRPARRSVRVTEFQLDVRPSALELGKDVPSGFSLADVEMLPNLRAHELVGRAAQNALRGG